MDEIAPTALLVVAHHRSYSLTAAVAERVAKRLELNGYRVDLLDLHAEGFDPRGNVADEPDYDDRDKRYTDEVHRHFARVKAADLIVPVFPVWWFGLPALLKGWFDRVWNYGLAYGQRESGMDRKRMLWLAIAGLGEGDPSSALTLTLLETLRRGISEYCGIPEVRSAALFDSEGKGLTGADRDGHYRELFARADAAIDEMVALAPRAA
jgi:putative NADPH-quinone reductase